MSPLSKLLQALKSRDFQSATNTLGHILQEKVDLRLATEQQTVASEIFEATAPPFPSNWDKGFDDGWRPAANGNERPFLHNGKWYLYVYKPGRGHAYYSYADDVYIKDFKTGDLLEAKKLTEGRVLRFPLQVETEDGSKTLTNVYNAHMYLRDLRRDGATNIFVNGQRMDVDDAIDNLSPTGVELDEAKLIPWSDRGGYGTCPRCKQHAWLIEDPKTGGDICKTCFQKKYGNKYTIDPVAWAHADDEDLDEATEQQPTYKVGDKVYFNGDFKGRIVKVHTGEMAGLYDVRGDDGRGNTTIGASEFRLRDVNETVIKEDIMPHAEVQRVFDETGDRAETELLCGVKKLRVNEYGQVVSYITEDEQRDSDGKWTSGGGSSKSSSKASDEDHARYRTLSKKIGDFHEKGYITAGGKFKSQAHRDEFNRISKEMSALRKKGVKDTTS